MQVITHMSNTVLTRMQDDSNLRQPPTKIRLPMQNVFIQI
jgi:hypothetical protein